MKKRISLIILSLLFILILSNTALAADEIKPLTDEDKFYKALSNATTNSSRSFEDNFIGTLINEDGSSYDVAIFKYEPECYNINDNNTATYVYALNDAYLKTSDETLNRTKWDNSVSVFGSVTIVFDRKSGTVSDEYLLTRVYGSWTKKDSSVIITDREVIYACLDGTSMSQWVSKKPTSNSFDYTTNFTQYVPETLAGSVLGATSRMSLKHGQSSTWTLTVPATLFGNDVI